MPVTPKNMEPVYIQPGWLTQQLNHYIQKGGFQSAVATLDKELASRNKKYENAWLTDYIVTSLVDLKDKLYRLYAATRTGTWIEWDDHKRRGTYYDILARTVMLMSLEDANSANLEGVLDDD